ncbi:MAG: hypothetical protein KGQ58_06255 [Proteobacteria bacterium]|nr:hypothetical protein [Pseudomonadota bacterium]
MPRTKDPEKLPEFSKSLAQAVRSSGLTQDEFADQLTSLTERAVSRARLASWIAGVIPRSDAEGYLAAAKEIAGGGKIPLPIWVEGAIVQAKIRSWLDRGVNRKILWLAAGVPQQTLSIWETGRVRVKRRTWIRVEALIEAWIKALDDAVRAAHDIQEQAAAGKMK